MPQAGGGFAGFVSGLTKGFGKTMLEVEQQKHEDAIRDKQNRISVLQHAIDSGNLDDESMQSATDQLGEILDGKPGGKTSEKLKAMLDPIIAVAKLMHGAKGSTPGLPPQGNGTNGPMSETLPAQKPPTGGGGFDIPTPPTRGRTVAPIAVAQNGIPARATMSGMKVKTAKQKQDEILAGEKAKILQQYALGDEEKKKQLAALPGEQQAQIDSNIKVARKYYRVVDKDNPNGRPLRDDENLPPSYSQAIIEDVLKIDPRYTQERNQTVKAIGRVEGKNLPADAKTITGEPITDRNGAYLPVYRGDTLLGYQREDKKPLASEVKFNQDVDDAMAADKTLTRESATQLVRTNNFKSRRLSIVNSQELLTGRQLANQQRKDIIEGKITPATARGVIGTIRTEALTIARADANGTLSPDSPYTGKSAAEIEDLLIPFYGYSKEELMKAVGGNTSPAAIPAAPKSGTRPPLGSFEGH